MTPHHKTGAGADPDIDPEALKKEIKQELLKREILMGIEDDEIDLFELGKVLWRRWRLVIAMPVAVALLAVVITLLMPNYYKAQTTIFVHSKGGGAMSSLLSSLPLGGMLGGLSLGGGGSAEYLMALLKSRAITDRIIQRFDLATSTLILGDPLPSDLCYDDVLKVVEEMVSITKDKDGLITVAVETKSATFSAEIAEAYLGFLKDLTKGPAREKRVFVETQLEKVKRELQEAEQAFKAFQDRHQLVALDEQAKALIENLVKLEAAKVESQIALKMQESLLKASGNVPELVKLEAQKVSEQARQAGLEKAIASVTRQLETVPQLTLEFTRLMRDLKVKEKVFGVLTEQLEMAKIAEAEEGSTFEIIDRARPPERKSKPKRSLIVILSGITAGMLGVFLAFFLEFLEKRRREEAARAASATDQDEPKAA
ncbi:MAG: Tyrosine-protein kinase Wzc [Candidatus Ozemobacter sibiricus]|jgi:uncharacterized protein involved in exopolysaccharide biosynthesis|uniref:Tyrosine-protein kinase Wzc n=1 Tax=Candidatus Ozemobacter sibiricus TaxID=2268124 RepID=A0A367ZR06_9BACT|nr:MAG: Tyrosine-protein kinase Wzc [Candidatus Ozemobacter sibiricus]